VNARGGWKLVTFDLDLWPWELFSYLFNLFQKAWPSNLVLCMEVRLENIYVPVQFQGQSAKVKVTAAKRRRTGLCSPRTERNYYLRCTTTSALRTYCYWLVGVCSSSRFTFCPVTVYTISLLLMMLLLSYTTLMAQPGVEPKARPAAAIVKSRVCAYWIGRCRCWLVCTFSAWRK